MANVDQIILVMSLNLPPFDARQATRFLVSAEAASIPVMLLLNKADLLEDSLTQALVAEVMYMSVTCLASRYAFQIQGSRGYAMLSIPGQISASSHIGRMLPNVRDTFMCMSYYTQVTAA